MTSPGRGVEIIAHRGYSAAAPENTWSAVHAALRAGADAIEFDLQISADAVPVLMHDATLERTTNGHGPVQASSWSRLAELDAGAWFGEAFRGEPVPRLDRVLDALRGTGVRLYPEVKEVRRAGDMDGVVDLVAGAGLLDSTVFISIDWRLLDRVRRRAPGAAIGYIVTDAAHVDAALARAVGDPRALLDFDRLIPLADPTVCERARRAGVEMAAWTVDEVGEAARLLELGIGRIASNQVERMVAWRAVSSVP